MINKKRRRRKRLRNPLNTKLSELYLNFNVISSKNQIIGYVLSVINYGASDILVFKNNEDKKLMIPLTDIAISKIDSDNKQIFINEEFAI